MTKINYKFADGHYGEIEVTEELKRGYCAMLADEKRIERKETRRHISLDMLMEIEEQQNNQGSLASKSLNRHQDTYSLISSDLDPLEVLLEREELENLPIVKALSLGLTGYQQKIAFEFYINNKTYIEIAREFGINKSVVSRLIKKVQKEVLGKFM